MCQSLVSPVSGPSQDCVGLGQVNRGSGTDSTNQSGSTSGKDPDTADASLGIAGSQPMLIEDLLCLLHRIASCQGILTFFFFPQEIQIFFQGDIIHMSIYFHKSRFFKIIIIFDIYKELCAINYEMK